MKSCSNKNCKEINPQSFDKFYRRGDILSGYFSRCKPCCKISDEKRKDKTRIYKKKYELNKKYNLTLEAYQKMFVDQDNKCFICQSHLSTGKRGLHIDHDHKTGKVRSLLCSACNVLIGLSKESPDILRKPPTILKSLRNDK